MAVLVLATSPFVQQQLDALRAQAPHERIHTDASTAPPERAGEPLVNVIDRVRGY